MCQRDPTVLPETDSLNLGIRHKSKATLIWHIDGGFHISKGLESQIHPITFLRCHLSELATAQGFLLVPADHIPVLGSFLFLPQLNPGHRRLRVHTIKPQNFDFMTCMNWWSVFTDLLLSSVDFNSLWPKIHRCGIFKDHLLDFRLEVSGIQLLCKVFG